MVLLPLSFAVYTDTVIEVPHIGHGVEKVTVDMLLGEECSM